MSPSLKALRELSDEDLVSLHDGVAIHTSVGVTYYLDEIYRRDQDKQTKVMQQYTKQMLNLTYVVTVLTVINVVAVIVPFFYHP